MSVRSHCEIMLALGYPGEKKCSISIYVSFCSYLVQHPCHHISVTLMENIRDALLMFPPTDILLFVCLCLSLSSSGPPRQSEWRECVCACVSMSVWVCVWESECVSGCLLCIWASVTAQITAQCTFEHPVFKCQLSGRRTVTVPSQIRCPCDTMCLTPVYNKVSHCTSKDMNPGKVVELLLLLSENQA